MAKDERQQEHFGIGSGYEIGAFESRRRDCEVYQPIGLRARTRQRRLAKMHNGLKPMRFVSLHHHSTFSFLDGFQLPDAHVRRAAEINMGALAMTEHGNIFSHVRLEKAAVELGVKPIFGCELYVGWTDEKRRSQKKNHLTVIAKDADGYRNLLELVTLSWAQGFYYEPTVDWRWLRERQRGLVILSGCQGSALFTALVGGKHVPEEEASYRRGLRVARRMDEWFEDFYIEVQAFPELDKTRRANPQLARVARAIGRPLVATMDCHYTAPEEAEVQQILHAVRPGEQRTPEDLEREWGYDVPLCPPATDRSIYRRLRETGLGRKEAVEAIVSTAEIAEACNVELPKLPRTEFPLPDGYETQSDLFLDWVREGWRYRGCHSLPRGELERYRAQVRKEVEIIRAKSYESYFLIVSDAVKFAKSQGIPVGPARGSAAASLVCWLLRITEVNPLDFDNLVFERFIDWNREDMPDIDLDFATYGRPIIREYLEDKYGPECVSNVGTFTNYKAKNSLDDAARVHKVPKFEVEKLKGLLVERSSGDLRASATIMDTVDQFDEAYEVLQKYPTLQHAMDLEGNIKGFGIHAAGLVVSNGPITQVTSVLEREVNDDTYSVVAMDKRDAERQGLEKLDFLALSTMDMIAQALQWLDMSLEDFYALPFDDEEVIDGFRQSDCVGVFQFDGRATRIVCNLLKPDNFGEVIATNALSRPGPLHNGAAQGYVGVKWGNIEPELIHPAYDQIVASTRHQIIFQEQILKIVREIGDFSWTHAAYIRKIISQKLGDAEFNRQKKTFMRGAAAVHKRLDVPPMDAETAERIWGSCITAGSYAFNAAHSTAYSMIAYWTMWLKVKHPAIFYAASLAKSPKRSSAGSGGTAAFTASKADDLMRDAIRHDIEVRPPTLHGGDNWRPEGDTAVRAGWQQVPGIGEKMARKITQAAPESWDDLLMVPGVGPKTLDKLQQFTEAEDPFEITKLDGMLETLRDDLRRGLKDADGKPLPEPTHTATAVYEAAPGAQITFLGQPVHRNLRDVFESNRAKYGTALDRSEVNNPDLSQWVVLLARDSDEIASLVISRYKYPRFKDLIWKMKLGSEELILVTGKKGSFAQWGAEQKSLVFLDDIWVLEP